MTDYERNADVSKTLTDKLKKGELPDNHHYYFKLPKSKEYEVGNTFCLETLRWCKDGDKIEVLSEVPSYEEGIMTKNLSERAHLEMYKARGEKVKLEAENAQLKELLKDCKEYFENMSPDFDSHDFDEIISKINQALADNQIQANTVACNKIQEKNNGKFKI